MAESPWRRMLCWLFGHRWGAWSNALSTEPIDIRVCKRCGQMEVR